MLQGPAPPLLAAIAKVPATVMRQSCVQLDRDWASPMLCPRVWWNHSRAWPPCPGRRATLRASNETLTEVARGASSGYRPTSQNAQASVAAAK
eukprot:6203584-Pleurochrysis_carterae.AAC.1